MSEWQTQLAAALPKHSGTGPQWLLDLRKSAADKFLVDGLPTRKDETWKYTGLGLLEKTGARLADGFEVQVSGISNPLPLVETEQQVNMLDGEFLEQIGSLPTGLTILPLENALQDDINGLQTLLESAPDLQSNSGSSLGFSALNSATLEAGVVIHVAAGIDAGTVALIWSTRKLENPLLFNSRICVILEEDAKLELLEHFESLNDNANTSNIVLQVEIGNNASFQHIRFQQESDQAALITRSEVAQQAASDYTYYGFDLGGGLVRHDLHASLLGNAARANINGAYVLDGNRHVDNHARVDHRSPGGFSDQYFRGVAGGRSRAVFNTAVCVHPGADDTEARQSNANILLSPMAVVNTKPELEIYADEVIASHGATVGQLDEQAVFYLRSRGLSEQHARQVLTTAFCQSVSDRLPRKALGELIAQRMMDVMPETD